MNDQLARAMNPLLVAKKLLQIFDYLCSVISLSALDEPVQVLRNIDYRSFTKFVKEYNLRNNCQSNLK